MIIYLKSNWNKIKNLCYFIIKLIKIVKIVLISNNKMIFWNKNEIDIFYDNWKVQFIYNKFKIKLNFYDQIENMKTILN